MQLGARKKLLAKLWHSKPKQADLACFVSRDLGHGRAEERKVYLLENLPFIDAKEDWAGLKSIAMVERKVWRKGKEQNSKHFYISSLLVLVPKKWDNIFVTNGR